MQIVQREVSKMRKGRKDYGEKRGTKAKEEK